MKLLLLPFLIFPIVCFAYEPDRAKANFADDYATCAAYYTVMSEARKTVKNDEYVKKFIEVAQYAFYFSIKLSNKKVSLARLELDTKSMMKEIENDWSNTAIIINKYGDFCKNLMDNPEERLNYWLNKK